MVYGWTKHIQSWRNKPYTPLLNAFRSWLAPDLCLYCGHPGEPGMDLCPLCRQDLPYLRQACSLCALPLTTPTPSETAITTRDRGILCGQCLKKAPPVQRIVAPFDYSYPIRNSILALKFQGRHTHARLMGQLLAQHLMPHQAQPLPQIIIPVPLHPDRQRQRGFNQALELARPLARQLQIPLGTHLCRRIRPTPPQSTLNAKQRRNNIHGAFEVQIPPALTRVAILDDVITTGNTVYEIARLLQAQGVTHIEAWCVARASC